MTHVPLKRMKRDRECGQINPGDCQLNSGPFFQCCCNCQHHLPDYYHCTIHKDMRKSAKGCVCSIQKGWVCAGFLTQPGCNSVHSEWPEHSVGCEMYKPINKIQRPAWAACCSESDNCRRNNADVRGCCALG